MFKLDIFGKGMATQELKAQLYLREGMSGREILEAAINILL